MTQSSQNWLSAALAVALLVGCEPPRFDSQLDFLALGTEISVSLYGVDASSSAAAEKELRAYFNRVGHDWYPWLPGELASINKAIAAGETIAVSPRLAEVIRRAAELELRSHNRFNAGLGRLTELWGLHDITHPPTRTPDPETIAALLERRPTLGGIRWEGDRIVAAPEVLMLDLGGIAKGAILEDAARLLRDLGLHDAIVNIGGDLTVLGDVHGRAARIGIRSPVADAALASVDIGAGETVVTSGNYERYIEIGGQRYTHVLNPVTGYPVQHTSAVTVIHSDAMLADAAATALMVGGEPEFEQLCDDLGVDFALLIDASGDLRLTPGMRQRLQWAEGRAAYNSPDNSVH